MNVKIDSHHHFWNPKRGDYDWMPMDNEILARVYGPRDLEPHLLAAGIDQTILVQAAATVEETEYMWALQMHRLESPGLSAGSISKIKSMHIICAGWPNTHNFWASAR